MFTDITAGPVKSSTKPGKANIKVHYSNAPDEVNALIGLYPVGNPDSNKSTSWKFTLGETSGDYLVTASFTSGKYEFRIYNDKKVLLGTSAPVEVIGLTDQNNQNGNVVPEAPANSNNETIPASNSTELPKTARTLSAVAGDKMVDLKWDPIGNAAGLDGFYIYRSTTPDGSNVSPANDFPEVATSYTDKNVENGKTYFYMIKAVFSDKAGVKSYGEASNIVSATPMQGKGIMVLVIGNPLMKVNNVSKEIDPGRSTAPVTVNGRTFVPIRAIIETMGGSVSWVKIVKSTL